MKDTYNNPGSIVSVYQIHAAHPGLVPQFSGKLTSSRICSSQDMVEHFSDLPYVHLIKITSQEETLSVKLSFKILAAIFGVKIKIYNAYNGIFDEQPFR